MFTREGKRLFQKATVRINHIIKIRVAIYANSIKKQIFSIILLLKNSLNVLLFIRFVTFWTVFLGFITFLDARFAKSMITGVEYNLWVFFLVITF